MFFPDAPALFRRPTVLLIVSPHCDDETLGAGGVIAQARVRHIPVRVVFLTNGGWLAFDANRRGRATAAPDFRASPIVSPHGEKCVRRKRARRSTKLGVATTMRSFFLVIPTAARAFLWEKNWLPESPYRSSYTGNFGFRPTTIRFTPQRDLLRPSKHLKM